MKKHAFLGGAAIAVLLASAVQAHTPFSKVVKDRYKLRTVSCFACHKKGKDDQGKPLGKEHLNEFGLDLQKSLAGLKMNERVEAVKELEREERKKVDEAIAKEFLEVLGKMETKPSSSGKSWKALIEEGELEGVKLRSS